MGEGVAGAGARPLTVPAQPVSALLSDTDNDSDDTVNGGSPKPSAIRQHRKEKKEFPVSHPNSKCFGQNVRRNQPSHPLGFLPPAGVGLENRGLVVRRGYISHFRAHPPHPPPENSWLTLASNLKYVVFPFRRIQARTFVGGNWRLRPLSSCHHHRHKLNVTAGAKLSLCLSFL